MTFAGLLPTGAGGGAAASVTCRHFILRIIHRKDRKGREEEIREVPEVDNSSPPSLAFRADEQRLPPNRGEGRLI